MGWISTLVREARNMSTSAELDAFLRVGAMATYAGISVTPETALQVSAFFGAVRLIAEDIGKLPYIVYQQGEERVRAVTSPYWRLIHKAPNSYQSSQQFREYLTTQALLFGNGFALKNVVGGQVRELLPIPSSRVRIEQLSDFELIFHVTLADGGETPMTRREIFHLPSITMMGPAGVSILEYARQTVGIALGANRHAGTFFANGMKPSGVFEFPGTLRPDSFNRLRAELSDKYAGANSNQTVILENGMKFSPVTLNNTDSQFLESRVFEVQEVARWFRVPPHKIAELSRSTFSNQEQQETQYISDTLMAWATRWDSAFNTQVITTNSVFAELLFDALLRGTTLERYQAYQLAAGGPAPFMARNEVRRRENLPPLPGLDEILQPLNMGTAGERDDEGDEDADAQR